jgi:hypothetical protein
MDPVQILATLAVFAVVLKGIVDAVRRQWPGLDGLVDQIVAIVLGAGIAWAFDLRATLALLEQAGAGVGRLPAPALDYLITGAGMAFAAGFFAEVAGKSGGNAGTIIEIDEEGNPVL